MDSLHENTIGADELLPLLRERLAAGQTIRYLPFRGCSMLPLLRQGRDSVELSPLPEKLKKYDLPVYQMPSGKYLMHRVLKVTPTHYICLGDNTLDYETIAPEQMIGVVTAFQRNGKRIEPLVSALLSDLGTHQTSADPVQAVPGENQTQEIIKTIK